MRERANQSQCNDSHCAPDKQVWVSYADLGLPCVKFAVLHEATRQAEHRGALNLKECTRNLDAQQRLAFAGFVLTTQLFFLPAEIALSLLCCWLAHDAHDKSD